METAPQVDRRQPRLAAIAGLACGFAAAGAVSWATPDGNLVVTLVPGLVAGLVVYGIVRWRLRHGKAQ